MLFKVREFVVTDEGLTTMLATVMPHLDERQRRVLAGSTARVLGRGGIVAVAEATSMSRSTLQKAVAEIDAGIEPFDRLRAPGAPAAGHRRPARPARGPRRSRRAGEPGDPECRLRWTSKSTRKLSEELLAKGYRASHVTVADLLPQMDYSLQAPAKENEGAQHADRDTQFRHIDALARAHLSDGQPVISVDTKKKEVVGNLTNKGKEWQPKGQPVRVDVHDFPDPEVPKAVPYGIYDLAQNEGFVSMATAMTPPSSPWRRSGAGGPKSAASPTPMPNGSSSPPMQAVPTATAALSR